MFIFLIIYSFNKQWKALLLLTCCLLIWNIFYEVKNENTYYYIWFSIVEFSFTFFFLLSVWNLFILLKVLKAHKSLFYVQNDALYFLKSILNQSLNFIQKMWSLVYDFILQCIRFIASLNFFIWKGSSDDLIICLAKFLRYQWSHNVWT